MKMNLTIEDMSPAEALHVVQAAAAISPDATTQAAPKPLDVARTGRTSSAAPNQPTVLIGAGGGGGGGAMPTPEPKSERADVAEPVKPLIDKSKVAAIASANPAKAPKPEKPAAKPRGKKPVDDADMSDEEIDAMPTSDVITPAMKAALKGGAKDRVEEAGMAAARASDDDEEEEDDEPEAPADEPKKASAKSNGTNGAAKPAIAKELVEARKLRDVLAHLMDKDGLTDHDELKAKCAQIKDLVPCLQRITDLDSRIDRTLEVMDMGDDLS